MKFQLGEVYLVHLKARPFVPELRCTLGRETAIQKMKWTKMGGFAWYDGIKFAKSEVVEESSLPEYRVRRFPGLMILMEKTWAIFIMHRVLCHSVLQM